MARKWRMRRIVVRAGSRCRWCCCYYRLEGRVRKDLKMEKLIILYDAIIVYDDLFAELALFGASD